MKKEPEINVFKTRLKSSRLSRKWTQQDLAQMLNVARSTVAGWEASSKENFPDREILLRLAQIFGTSVDYLIGKSENPSPPNSYEGQWHSDIEVGLKKIISGQIPLNLLRPESEAAVRVCFEVALRIIQQDRAELEGPYGKKK
jgi:transcriptional regulator with XRE-family HTH domain